MDTNLMQASYQWATRPADERFESLHALHKHCLTAANNATTQDIKLGTTQVVVAANGDLELATGFSSNNLKFNNWSFSQMASRTGTNTGQVTDLPPELAAQTINHRIKARQDLDSQIYFDKETLIARAFTSQSYARIFNHEIVKAVMDLPGKWVTPPARPAFPNQPGTRVATIADCTGSNHPGLSIKPGDLIAPAGLYGSDRDMFVFMIDPETQISDGSDGGLSRGFFIRNSEVGNAVFELVTYLYRFVCSNHIVWGAESIQKVSIKHIGDKARQRAFDKMAVGLKEYREFSGQKDEASIKIARNLELGATYEDLLDNVFRKQQLLGKSQVKAAYDKANEHADTDGSPRSLWGFVNGVTRISQESLFADERTQLDRAAGQLMKLAA